MTWRMDSHSQNSAHLQIVQYLKTPGLEVKKLEYSLKLKIKRSDWLLVDTCPQAANHSALFWVWEWTQI